MVLIYAIDKTDLFVTDLSRPNSSKLSGSNYFLGNNFSSCLCHINDTGLHMSKPRKLC